MSAGVSHPRVWRRKVTVAVLASVAVYNALIQFGLSDRFSSLRADPFNVMEMQSRVSPILDRIPLTERVGYFSDVPISVSAGRAAFLAAQHAFAPRLLVREDAPAAKQARYWLAVFSKEQDYVAPGTQRGLVMERDLGAYLIFYRRREAGR